MFQKTLRLAKFQPNCNHGLVVSIFSVTPSRRLIYFYATFSKCSELKNYFLTCVILCSFCVKRVAY